MTDDGGVVKGEGQKGAIGGRRVRRRGKVGE